MAGLNGMILNTVHFAEKLYRGEDMTPLTDIQLIILLLITLICLVIVNEGR